MSFQFVQGRFDFPALVIERRQFPSRGLIGIEDGGDQPIEGFGAGMPASRYSIMRTRTPFVRCRRSL